jgi:glycosyltransferase involved in cell wall biosynthesis
VDDDFLPFVEIGPQTPKVVVPDPSTLIDVSFFVPCLNEEKHVVGVIEKLKNVCDGLSLSFEILVVDDGSTDKTVEQVTRYQNEHPDTLVRLLVNKVNQGIARNFVEAAFQARGKYYRLVCGDDVEPEDTLTAILSNVGKADIIIPYHTHVEGRSLSRRVISKTYTRLVNMASGQDLHYYNGLPLYRRQDVMRFHVEATGLGYQAEFLLRLLQEDRSYQQIPLTAMDREGSVALSVRNFVSVGYTLFKILVKRVRSALFN